MGSAGVASTARGAHGALTACLCRDAVDRDQHLVRALAVRGARVADDLLRCSIELNDPAEGDGGVGVAPIRPLTLQTAEARAADETDTTWNGPHKLNHFEEEDRSSFRIEARPGSPASRQGLAGSPQHA